MVCVILFIVLFRNKFTPDEQKQLGWGIIMLIMFSVCKNFSVVIYFGVKGAREKLRKMFSADD